MKNTSLIQIALGVITSFYMTGCTDAQSPKKFSPMEFNIDESVLSDSKTIFNEFSIQLPKIFNQLDPSLLQEIKVVMEKQQVSHIIEPDVVDIYTEVKWYFPKIKSGQLLAVPLTKGPKPVCAYFVKDISRQCEQIDYGSVW